MVLSIHYQDITIGYYKLKSLSSKIQHALFHELTPTFAKVKGQFINHKDQHSAVKSILNSHLLEHRKNLRSSLTVIYILERL